MNYIARELERYFEPVAPLDFYREIFPTGSLDVLRDNPADREGHAYTAIMLEVERHAQKGKAAAVKRYTVTDDLDILDTAIWSENYCFMSPVSFIGKTRHSANARYMFALVVELDNLRVDKRHRTQTGLQALIRQWGGGPNPMEEPVLPCPTYCIASGTGVHLYYLFEQPMPMYPSVVAEMKNFKRDLTVRIWNRYVTTSYSMKEIQQESIFQAFRVVGSLTKKGDKVEAFRTGKPVTMEYLNLFVKPENRVTMKYSSKMSLAEAKERYPDWYERRVVQKKPKGRWVCNRAVYGWWKRRILNEAVVGHRYYCLMILCIYAVKCDIALEELEADCLEITKKFDRLSTSEANRFTEQDMLAALQAFEDKTLVTYPVNSISNRSGLAIEKNKRNHRPQAQHLARARAVLQVDFPNYEWAGRPSKAQTVRDWRAAHPDGKKADCIRETGLAKQTVYTWWEK